MFETFADVEALETSTKVTPGKGPYGVNGRKAETTYVLDEQGDVKVVARLTTTHWGDRKQFATRLTHETVKSEGGFSVSTWGSDHAMMTVYNQPVARYSAKALEAAHAAALEAFAAGYADRFHLVFDRAVEMHGIGLVEA